MSCWLAASSLEHGHWRLVLTIILFVFQMFWGKTMGQEMAEPVWHCCSINPAGAAGSHYFAGCYLAQAKVSWHFVTSPEAQLLEKLCQGPECINGTELFWQASHGFSNPQPLLRGSTTSYTPPKLHCRCAYLCLQLWYSNAWLCAHWAGWILTCGPNS